MNENDLITLNAYIDDELPPEERQLFEQKLAADPHLREEMMSFRHLKMILTHADRVPLPRTFFLSKEMAITHQGFLETLFTPRLKPRLAAGLSMIASFILVASGVFFLLNGSVGSARNAAMAPELYDQASEAELMEDAAQEPMAAMEAPASEMLPAPLATPSPASDMARGMGEEISEPTGEAATGMGGGISDGADALQAVPPIEAATADIPAADDQEEVFILENSTSEEVPATEEMAGKATAPLNWRILVSTILLISGGVFLLLGFVYLSRIFRNR